MKRVRWGILGTADIAPSLLEGIRQSSNSEAKAIASRDLARGRAWGEKHGVPLAFGSYDALLKSGEVDVVYVPLPNSLHAEWTLKALEAGLPVLCEKPFTSNAAEAREVLKMRDKTGLPVMEAFRYRFHPMHTRIMDLLSQGAIGEVVFVRSAFSFVLDEPNHIAWSAELAGGALMDVGCYCVSLARRVAGCEPTRAMAFQRGTSVDATLVGFLEFSNKMLGQVECSFEYSGSGRAEIAGTKGSILMESPWSPGDESAEFILRREGEAPERIVTPGSNRFKLEVEDLANAVMNKTQPSWPIEDAVANMAAIDALKASARAGSAVSVDPSA